jgi:hypothetical protein
MLNAMSIQWGKATDQIYEGIPKTSLMGMPILPAHSPAWVYKKSFPKPISPSQSPTVPSELNRNLSLLNFINRKTQICLDAEKAEKQRQEEKPSHDHHEPGSNSQLAVCIVCFVKVRETMGNSKGGANGNWERINSYFCEINIVSQFMLISRSLCGACWCRCTRLFGSSFGIFGR